MWIISVIIVLSSGQEHWVGEVNTPVECQALYEETIETYPSLADGHLVCKWEVNQ